MSCWRRPLRVPLAVLLMLSPVCSARALDWVVVPYGAPASAPATRAADKLVRALAERRLAVASLHELKDLLLARSRAAVASEPQAERAIAEQRKRALEHAAFGRREPARRAAEEVLRSAEAASETLLRDSDVARNVLDACLALVRIDLQARDRPLAIKEAQRCRALVPDLAPRESTHSAEVVGVLAEADNELRRAGAGALSVVTGTDEACAVFINGRRLGTTPFRYERAPYGAIRVFIECDTLRSRVHIAQLGEAEQTLTIDPRHDARISDRDALALSYRSEQELTEQLAGDAARLADTLGARRLVLLRELPDTAIEAVRYDPARQRAVASVRIEGKQLLGTESVAAQQAAEALALERRESALPAAFQARPASPAAPPVTQPAHSVAPTPASAAAPETVVPAARPVRRRRVWTWSFGAATVAAGGVALGLGLEMKHLTGRYDGCDPGAENCQEIRTSGQRYERATNAMLGVTGGLAAATLLSFFLEGRRREPRQVAVRVAGRGFAVCGSF